MKLLHTCASLAWALVASTAAHASCGSAFCSVNTDWASAAAGLPEGSVLDLRFESIRQDQPRTGTRNLAVGQVRRHHDEVRTTNRNLLLTYSRNFASGWGLSVTAPWVEREHLHIHNHGGGQIPESWSFRELGDVRVLGRYRADVGDPAEGTSAGAVFGLKLPTGRRSIANAAGDVAERTLQPGTGTTDAIVGGFYNRAVLALNGSVFAQATLQHALNARDDFRPGSQLALDLGYAQRLNDRFAAQVQLNAVLKRRDSGAQAEPEDSGSRALYLSPGLSVDISDGTRAYVAVQQRLYQSVNGVQLTARRGVVVGLSTLF